MGVIDEIAGSQSLVKQRTRSSSSEGPESQRRMSNPSCCLWRFQVGSQDPSSAHARTTMYRTTPSPGRKSLADTSSMVEAWRICRSQRIKLRRQGPYSLPQSCCKASHQAPHRIMNRVAGPSELSRRHPAGTELTRLLQRLSISRPHFKQYRGVLGYRTGGHAAMSYRTLSSQMIGGLSSVTACLQVMQVMDTWQQSILLWTSILFSQLVT